MNPRNLQTILAYRDQELLIDLGKVFTGVLTASMARDRDSPINPRTFEIVGNRYIKLLRQDTQDRNMEEEIKDPVLGRWYFDVRQETEVSNHLVYTGTIFFQGNITK